MNFRHVNNTVTILATQQACRLTLPLNLSFHLMWQEQLGSRIAKILCNRCSTHDIVIQFKKHLVLQIYSVTTSQICEFLQLDWLTFILDT